MLKMGNLVRYWYFSLKEPITTAKDVNICTSLLIFEINKVWYFMRIVCQQMILMIYHALFLFLKKQHNLKVTSDVNYRWHFMVYYIVDQ